MAPDDRLSDLLVDWELSQRDGHEPTLEELCKDAPELLPVVRESINSLKATRWMLEPGSGETWEDREPDESRAALHDTELPASHLTVEQFAASIFQSGLLSAAEIDDLNQRLTASHLPGEAREVASKLVTEGKLTRYQASVLLKASKDPLLIDNYVILDTLDTGGMGLVFKALHRSMNRVVALKLLPAAMMGARDTVKRFQREVQAAAALSHPNIVAAYDAHQSDEIAYLVLEYVEGINLFRLVKEQGPLPVAVAANYVRQAATGLAYLHSRGLIHRDVKPANLILAADGTVKLLDMGLVRFASSEDLSCAEMDQELTQAGIVIGTVAYMSPEQALDTRSADQRSDIYSLGCTLFFLLTGRSLYHEETGMKTLLAHREQPVPTIREFCEDAPVTLDAVFRTMVAKRPADRLQTMSEIVAALDACVPGLATNSPAPRLSMPMPNRATFGPSRWRQLWNSRRPRIAGAIVLLAAIGAAGTYFAGVLIRIKSSKGTTDVWVDDANPTVEIISSAAEPSKVATPTTATGEAERRKEASSSSPDPFHMWLAPSRVVMDSEFTLAVWVLKLGGRMSAGLNVIDSLQSIPNRPFKIDTIRFDTFANVDDSSLQSLAAIHPENLKTLSLSGTRVTDQGLTALRGFDRLVDLNLSGTQITDEGVKVLSSFAQLHELDLTRTRITNHAVSHLAALPNLSVLKLSDNNLTDAALLHLPHVRSLALDGTGVTDAGLQQLATQTGLGFLSVSRTKVTPFGIAKLQAALPKCEIEHLPDAAQNPSDPFANKQTLQAGKAPAASDHPTPQSKAPPAPSDSKSTAPRKWFAGVKPRRPVPTSEITAISKPIDAPSVDRRVAHWALNQPIGRVWFRETSSRVFSYVQELPPGDIHIIGITFLPEPSRLIRFESGDLERLASLSELKWLNLPSRSVTDDFVLRFKSLPQLTRLGLASANITDACLPALAGMTHLTALDLRNTKITDAGLEQLSKIKSLNDLTLDGQNQGNGAFPIASISDPGARTVPVLILGRTQTTEAGLLKLQQALPNCVIFASHIYPGSDRFYPLPPKPGSSDAEWARWLLRDGSCCWVRTDLDPDTTTNKATNLPPIDFHIQELGLIPGANGFPDANEFLLRRLGDLTQLRLLELHGNFSHSGSPQALEGLRALKSLNTLILQDSGADDESLQPLAALTGVTTLVIDGDQITDAGLKSLAPLKGLTRLALNGHARNLHGRGFESLAGLTNLRTLEVAGSGLDDDGAHHIGRLTGLEKLDLHDTWISRKGLAELGSLKHLKTLNLAHCRRLQGDDFAALGELSSLQHLDLSQCRITDASFEKLVETLKKLKNLRTLNTSVSPPRQFELKRALPQLERQLPTAGGTIEVSPGNK
jgi:serine/threonine protein kinase/Leucine-rich repeat (LRR) protein